MRHVLLACSLLIALLATAGSVPAATCIEHIVGVDTSLATDLDGPILGEAYGEVFFAPASLIRAITVWRIAAEDTNDTGLHLFLTAVDSLGQPAPNSILLDGPTIIRPYGDGIHPIPLRFEFDPPYALPAPGRYYFAIQANPCSGYFNLLFNGNNAYSEGSVWRNGRTYFSGCHLRNYPEQFPLADLVFTIEFCELTQASATATWGSVKAAYR